MLFRTPRFWFEKSRFLPFLLWPLEKIYGYITARRMRYACPPHAKIPVLCVGNYTLGGGGKTPLALSLAKVAQEAGLNPGFLTRGYGGTQKEPVLVLPTKHTAPEVGDEALLLAKAFPTVVASARVRGAQLLTEIGCDFIVMDDGFQSRRLLPDCSVIVMDAALGLGNRHVFPAGPLRAPLEVQQDYTDFLVRVTAQDQSSAAASRPRLAQEDAHGALVLEAYSRPCSTKSLYGKKVWAFCGIAQPEKFFSSLSLLGAHLCARSVYPDHYSFQEQELYTLYEKAQEAGLCLVTTQKDYVRFAHFFSAPPIAKGGVREDLRKKAFFSELIICDVTLVFAQKEAAQKILQHTLSVFKKRALASA